MATQTPDTPVDLVVRFTTSIPDLILTVVCPSLTTTLSLKQRIRSHLPVDATSNRLRLISAGKVLIDVVALSKSIAIPPAPPRSGPGPPKNDPKGKGKAPLRASPPPQLNPRVYIHCSIGDALTPEELQEEATAAETADAALKASTQPAYVPLESQVRGASKALDISAPRGFDRLLSAGFSAAEVATLRTQFLAIQSHTHTPDTMPMGDDLRALEDRWLDSGAGAQGATGGGDGEGGFSTGEEGGLEDMLWGNLVGFFWPVAAVCWLMREEGVWTRRRQIAVLSGMLLNLTFGFLRLSY